MSTPGTSGLLTVQDDENLGAWSGVFVDVTDDIAALNLVPGDRVSITAATISDSNGLTELEDATLTRTSTGDPYGYKVVTTGVLAQDDATAEAHEGMALRFENVTVTSTNPDGPRTSNDCGDENRPEIGFGEWSFVSTPDEGEAEEDDAVRADNASDGIACDFNVTTFSPGATVEFIQGLWSYSFGNYKLLPESSSDVGTVTVDAEDSAQASAFVLERAYPNPFSRTTKIAYEVGVAGRVSLKVYDVLGREVATLVDDELAPRRYEATLDGSGLASGVYLFRLTAGDLVRTGRVTLVK